MLKKTTIVLLICINLVMLSVVPVFAWTPNFSVVTTEDELADLTVNEKPGEINVISGQVKITKSINLKTNSMLVIGQDPQADEGTIVIENGGELVIDAPLIKTIASGETNLIRVKKGGRLILKSGSLERPISIWNETQSTAVIEEGGVCEVYNGFKLIYDDWDFKYLIDGKITYVDGQDEPEDPEDPEEPEVPVEPEYTECYGEVVKTDNKRLMTIYFAMPLLNEEIESLTVQSFDGSSWNDRIHYDQDEYMPDGFFRYSPDNVIEYLSWNHRKKPQSFLAFPEMWTEETAGQYVTYRIIYNYEDDYEMSNPIEILIPETGNPMPFTTENDYDDVDGNRGGIGQGESERHPVPDKPDNKPETEVKPESEMEPEISAKPENEVVPEIPAEPENEAKPETVPEQENAVPDKTEKPVQKPESEMVQEENKHNTSHKDNTSIYKETDSDINAIPGVAVAITVTIGAAGSAYVIARTIKKKRR